MKMRQSPARVGLPKVFNDIWLQCDVEDREVLWDLFNLQVLAFSHRSCWKQSEELETS